MEKTTHTPEDRLNRINDSVTVLIYIISVLDDVLTALRIELLTENIVPMNDTIARDKLKKLAQELCDMDLNIIKKEITKCL